jgi:hypothetical protein
MDEAKLAVRVSRQFCEPERVCQTELGPEPAQVIKELDGIGVGHCFGARHLAAVTSPVKY